MSEELLTGVELAERLRVSPSTIQQWAHDGKIPCVRVSSNRTRFEWAAVLDVLRNEPRRERNTDLRPRPASTTPRDGALP